MSLVDRLTEEMKTSMKAGDGKRTGTLRLLRGALKNEEIKRGHALGEDEALAVLQREAKQRQDSAAAYRNGGREELAAAEETELALIKEFLPEQMSEDEVAVLVDEVIGEIGATDVKQMGAVIGKARQKAGAAADGAVVARLVKERLS